MGTIKKNSREFHRINFESKVNLHFMNNQYSHCRTKNISLTGMFVEGDFEVNKDEQCQTYFFLSKKSEKTIFKTQAKVAWRNKDGIALQFVSMPIVSYTSLVEILVNNTELPEVVLYEISKICPFEIARA